MIRFMWTGEEAREAGIVYLEEGIRTFELRSGVRFTVSGLRFIKSDERFCYFTTNYMLRLLRPVCQGLEKQGTLNVLIMETLSQQRTGLRAASRESHTCQSTVLTLT